MSKFKVGQKVVIDCGVMWGNIGEVIEVLPHGWYDIKIEGKFDSISYLECELRSLN